FLTQAQNQKAVMILALDRRMLDRARELDRLFEAAVSNLELVMGNTFAAEAIAAQPGDAEQLACAPDLDIVRLDAREVDLYDPAVVCAINVGRRTPQASRRATLAPTVPHA